jgi:hypothetical protein
LTERFGHYTYGMSTGLQFGTDDAHAGDPHPNATAAPSLLRGCSMNLRCGTINDIGERCEAEGIYEDDHDSEHGAGQLRQNFS